ncbi:MAG: glycosyltransferase [Planctomycetota bacterium]|jgi:trehalose synthase
MRYIEDYRSIVGEEVIFNIYKKARPLYGKHILNINSTFQGGGVAEILSSLVPLMNDIGVDAGWRIIHGNPDLYEITKKFHNALQGGEIHFTDIKKDLYIQANETFSVYTHIDHDCVVIHDPQPLPLIKFYRKRQPWVWRCHVDLSDPNKKLWEFLKSFIIRYDMLVVSSEDYIKNDIPLERKVIFPAIDPLSPKNMDLTKSTVKKYLEKFEIPEDKPLITQISRFDKWKDPEGVIEVFKLVKKKVDARLVLCGSMAADDPEGWMIYENIKQKAQDLVKKGDLILITSENNILVNALQRSSAAIVQKSLKEGFGLSVTEAMWKETPVIASDIGGIPLQIKNGESGFLLKPTDWKGFAERIALILENPKLAREMGKRGKEIVRENFLLTRLLSDYLDLFNKILQ